MRIVRLRIYRIHSEGPFTALVARTVDSLGRRDIYSRTLNLQPIPIKVPNNVALH